MPLIAAEDILNARQMDLLTYLQLFEPGELVKLQGENYCTREHDSLKISNGKWHWFSRGIGGRTALDYLVKVKGMSFPDAVETILGKPVQNYSIPRPAPVKQERKLLLPEVDSDYKDVSRYLQGRGINAVIIDYCVKNKLLFQTSEYHNAMFVGYDEKGTPRYAALRGINGRFKSEATGSDKRYAFSIMENSAADTVHVFESAIDLMSYATLQLYDGGNWRQDALLSLAGVYVTKRQSVVPVALQRFLDQHPQVHTLRLHLDNDEVGRGATTGIMKGLKDKYTVIDEPPTKGKDVNEQLQIRVGLMRRKEEHDR